MQHLQPNTTLQGGKYRIERVLGQGGFGITYLAKYDLNGRLVAIKELFIGGSGQVINDRRGNQVVVTNAGNQQVFKKHKEKFKKEALRLSNFHHPNLVKVIEYFEENNTAYYVMSYIQGESLRSKLNREGAIEESLVLDYLRQLLSALDVVHRENIWHLDIKPDNIMVDKKEKVYLIDFGASKHIEQAGTLTTSSMMAFTPGYYPPEQLSPDMKNIGAWTDLYSLGATLYNLLTNKYPPTFDMIYSEEERAFSFPSYISSSTRDLIIKMMKPNRNDRPKNISVVRSILIKREEVNIEYNSKRNQNHRPHRKNTSFTKWIFGLLAAGLTIGFGYYIHINNRKQKIIQSIVDNMVYIEGGTFKMGHDDSQRKPTDSYLSYGPVHKVTLSPFYMSKYEVTQEEWEAVMGYNPSLHIGANYPVERVSWNEAKIFVEKLSSISGHTFRLPTEAEWEYAARGGQKSLDYSFSGSNNYDDVAWCCANSHETHEVGSKKANELGLYDMSGNVIEYCQDNYHDYNSSSQQDPSQSYYATESEFIPVVCRGGSVESDVNNCRVFERDSRWTTAGESQLWHVGLRIVCTSM